MESLDNLEPFQTIGKLSKQSGVNTDNLKTFQTIWKVYRQSGKFPHSLETYQTIWKLDGVGPMITDPPLISFTALSAKKKSDI